MKQDLTIVIPTHNRHRYFGRFLDYYSHFDCNVLIVDSTANEYKFTNKPLNIFYDHLPTKTFTGKLSYAFNKVKTWFVVLCADDDFLVNQGLIDCLQFLKINKEYSAVIGNVICYKKETISKSYVDFYLLYYNRFSFKITNTDPLERLDYFFKDYRTIFSAVHYTETLKLAFQDAETAVKNLFLNEYLTAVVPIAKGFIVQLPIFFQIRESSETSDDKNVDNLDNIVFEDRYKLEYESFLDHQSNIFSKETGINFSLCKEKIREIFLGFAKNIAFIKKGAVLHPEKKVGKIVAIIPFFGKKIIRNFRDNKNKKQLKLVVTNNADEVSLLAIKKVITRYANDIK